MPMLNNGSSLPAVSAKNFKSNIIPTLLLLNPLESARSRQHYLICQLTLLQWIICINYSPFIVEFERNHYKQINEFITFQ
jgi:hypothetical protein